MTGINAVSLPNGAGSAEKAIKKNLEWIEKFKRVYICFDSDDPGVDATDKAMDIIRPGLALRVNLERKDACEYLEADDKQSFKQALDSAKGKTIDAYFTRDKLTEEWLSFWSGGNKGGVETGIQPLDDWGIRLRPGELTTVYALPAVGKSSLVRQIAANWVNKGLKVLLVPFEEQGIKYFAQVVGMVNQFKIMASPPKTMEDKVKLLASVEDKLFLSTINLATPSNKLTHLLEYACRSEDINLVIFDNITKYTATSLQQTQEIGTVMSHLVQVAQKCKAHVICVSHTSRDRELKDGQAPGLQSGYNSGSIERFSDTVITMGRVPTSNLCEVAVRKDRANNKIGEFNIIFDPVSYTFKGVNNDQENLRQSLGTNGSGGSTEPDTHTEPSETECDTLHDDTCVQPGLQDSPQQPDVVHRSERETMEGRRTEVQRSSVIDEWNPSIRITKSFPTICPPQYYHYL
jgi:KaiC/GvpD/RAD55 family RecA-like ATPase